MRWPRDADVTFQKQEPVLIERRSPAAPAAAPEPETGAERDEVLALDPQQRAIVEAQWAVVERAFRRDLPNHRQAEHRPMPPAAPAPARRPDTAVEPPLAALAPAERVVVDAAQMPVPIGRPVAVAASTTRKPPEVRTRWFGGPSAAEQKRILKPQRLGASASGAAQRQRATLLSVLAIACASAGLAIWRMDRPADRRVTAEPPGATTPLPTLPSAAPAPGPSKPSAASVPPARQGATTTRPAVAVPPRAAAAASDPGPAPAANEAPAADRSERSAPPGRAVAPVRTAAPPRAEAAPRRVDSAPTRSTRSTWQRDERRRGADARAAMAPSWVEPSPLPETQAPAAGPMPAPLPYHPSAPAGWRSRPDAAPDMRRGMAAPLPYGGPDSGAGPSGR